MHPADTPNLEQVAHPAVAEAFHNHGGVQFKCYAIGAHVHCAVKASIGDVGCSADSSGEALIDGCSVPCSPPHMVTFDSLKTLPLARSPELAAAAPPEAAVLQACADAIRRRLGLALFGFDLIRSLRTPERYVLIDVNAFPSYKGHDGAAAELRALVKQAARERAVN